MNRYQTSAPYYNPRQPCPSACVPALRPQYDRHNVPAALLKAIQQYSSASQPRRCHICSYSQQYPAAQIPIYHRHFSSLRLSELTVVEANNSHYLCPSCMSHHLPYPEDRIKVVVSDSTLHQFFAPPGNLSVSSQYQGDTMHVDYITIPGGDIETLTNAFRLDYVDRPHNKLLDFHFVGGYNDMVEG